MADERLILQLRNAADAYSRRRAAESLANSKKYDEQIISALAEGLLYQDNGVKDICSRALVNLPNEWKLTSAKTVAPLITHNEIEVRNLAGDILTRIGNISLDALLPYLTDEDPDNKKFACDIIGLIGEPENGKYIRNLMDDDVVNVVSSAAEAVGNLKDRDSLGKLLEVYNKYEELRPIVIDSVGKIGGKSAEEFLIDRVRTENDLFLKTASIDALAFCGQETSIAIELMDELPNVPEELQTILLKTILAISYRQNQAISLPNELKYIARNALLDDDVDIRMAGLFALGDNYSIEDVPSLVNEVLHNNPDTQQHILHNLLSSSEQSACSKFFRLLYTSLDEDSSLIEIVSYLPMFWEISLPANATEIINTIINITFEKPKEHSSQIVEILLQLEKSLVFKKIRSFIVTGSTGQIKEAIDLIQNLNLQDEFENDLMQLGSVNTIFTEMVQTVLGMK